MLFTTIAFGLGFLPVVYVLFFAIGRLSHAGAAGWLLVASLFFYGYWMPAFTLLLAGSICVNFFVGRAISGHVAMQGRPRARTWLIAGITFNLALLSYFKYANFLVDTFDMLSGINLSIGKVTLPIGISFFTFTQIAFLADAYQKGVSEYRPTHYGLFVTYFPHLIAGPVLHHAQMMPQFRLESTYRIDAANTAAGLTIFAIGLLKKIVIADSISPYADAVFDAASQGTALSGFEAWLGSLAYTFQLYFDFSGYSDMAVGLSLMFNIRLPYNFDSPYKALNISDFWRRWHMTLSAFLRDYLYIPLGGNRLGSVRRYVNLMVTMLLGGLWHGASWTFVVWGGLHGLYLVVNHGYHALAGTRREAWSRVAPYRAAAWAMTFVAVVIAWVFFRAPTFDAANTVLRAMFGGGQSSSGGTDSAIFWNAGTSSLWVAAHCTVLAVISVFLPNSNAIGERVLARCVRDDTVKWVLIGATVVFGSFLIVINETRNSVSPFIYFNF
ncbi:MAG: MBOAT family protein [Betaproteobacteria bacterium]|nr:MBOAT family protein [Betaproteobacteria bacterium]